VPARLPDEFVKPLHESGRNTVEPGDLLLLFPAEPPW